MTVLIALLTTTFAFAATNASIPEIGTHTPILKFEKNENPQNLMIVYTKLDEKTCSFAPSSNSSVPILDEYWLMDGKTYKKVHPLIKNGIAERLELDRGEYERSRKFLVHLKDFHELKSDLGNSPTIEVKPVKTAKGCDAKVEMRLGPSDKNRLVAVDSIFADSEKKALPPFRRLKSLTIKGKDAVTGAEVQRTYPSN